MSNSNSNSKGFNFNNIALKGKDSYIKDLEKNIQINFCLISSLIESNSNYGTLSKSELLSITSNIMKKLDLLKRSYQNKEWLRAKVLVDQQVHGDKRECYLACIQKLEKINDSQVIQLKSKEAGIIEYQSKFEDIDKFIANQVKRSKSSKYANLFNYKSLAFVDEHARLMHKFNSLSREFAKLKTGFRELSSDNTDSKKKGRQKSIGSFASFSTKLSDIDKDIIKICPSYQSIIDKYQISISTKESQSCFYKTQLNILDGLIKEKEDNLQASGTFDIGLRLVNRKSSQYINTNESPINPIASMSFMSDLEKDVKTLQQI